MPADEALTSADREEGDGQTDHSCCSVCAFGMRWECATVRGQPFVISPHHPVAGGPAYPVKCYFAQVYVQAEASGPGSFAISPGDFYMKGEDGEVWHYGDGNSTTMGLPVFSGGTLQPGEHATGMVNFDIGAESGWIVYAPEGTPTMRWHYDVMLIE
jgi:hypothetical protein